MNDIIKSIIQNSTRYNDFTLLDKPIKFSTLFKNKDYEVVQVHSTEPIIIENKTVDIVGFCGVFSWIGNNLKPLDQDIYNKDVLVLGYNEFKNGYTENCIDILVGNDW